eukprot:CAMPEP_0170470336 /NCGR_PEP_ID=MMETSP0123-20130129/12823_1 /TAXON_ID=182087 /ORGANISM="Favella ehrenbergii, Strain Fehren 1" /LENGTH=121 /DNA_ID=CAMNT_0010737417 /DNA_START=484 /DNA_END=849 /DNA_ORIENTATION=-
MVSIVLILINRLPGEQLNMLQQALSTAFSLGVNFIVSNQAVVQFNPAVTIAISVFQALAYKNVSLVASLYFLVCFFGPLIGGIAAGYTIPVKEEKEPFEFRNFVRRLKQQSGDSLASFSTD